MSDPEKIEKTEEQWKQELDSETYRVTRQAGTEAAFGRALQAVKRGGSILSTCRKEALDTYNEVKSFFLYNSTNMPILNRIEKKLIKRKDKKAGE